MQATGHGPTPPAVPLRLTPREREILAGVLRGLGNKEIAAELSIGEQSVKAHVSTLLQKFGVSNRAALAETATRFDLTGEPGIDRTWLPELFRQAEPQICVVRGPELRYEAANEAFRQATGNRAVIGRTMRETFPELEGQGIFEQVEHVYATGEPTIWHERTSRWDRGNGIEARAVDVVIQPLHDEDGSVNGVISFAVDVTDSVEERHRLEALGDELTAVLELVPSGVIVTDEHGKIVRTNLPAERIGLTVAVTRAIDGALHGESLETEAFAVRPFRDSDGHIRGAIVVFTAVA
jgi:PAS domain S-box-containing protein